jgi:hypothetical protein
MANDKTTYKVWIEIEEYNADTEEGRTLDAPGASVAEFETYHQAWEFADLIYSVFVTLSRTKGGTIVSRRGR